MEKKIATTFVSPLNLRYFRKQYANIQPINTSKMINYTFIDTTFEELYQIVMMDKGIVQGNKHERMREKE